MPEKSTSILTLERGSGFSHLFSMVASLALTLLLLSNEAMAEQGTISVTAGYRERIALPPDAILEVELLDVSRADAPSTTLSYMRFKQDRVPFDIPLPYDPALIDERFTYVVAARIRSGGSVIFRTTSAYPVLTRGAGDQVDLLLQKMPAQENAHSSGNNRIMGIEWAVFEIGGRVFIGDDPPEIVFQEDGHFSLFGGCNRFSGKAEIGNGTVTFPAAFAGTRRACAPTVNKLENDVLDALSDSVLFERNGKNLVFQRENGLAALRFRQRV